MVKNTISKAILTIALLIVIALSLGLSSRQSSYNSESEKGLQNTLTQKTKEIFVVWGVTKGVSGLISVLQSFEFGVSFGVEGSLKPLEFLSAIDNVLDTVSDVCLYAIGAIMIEKLFLALSGWLALGIIIPVCMLLCILSLWIGKYKGNIMKILFGFSLIGFSVCIAVPLSIGLSNIIEKKIFTHEINKTMDEINLKNTDVENMQGDIDKQGFSAGKIINSIKTFFADAKDLASSLISDVINYIMIFIVTNIIMPLLTIVGLGFITKYVANLLLASGSKAPQPPALAVR